MKAEQREVQVIPVPSQDEFAAIINGSVRFALHLVVHRFWLFVSLCFLSAFFGTILFLVVSMVLRLILSVTTIDLDHNEHISDVVAMFGVLVSLTVISASTKQIILRLYDQVDTKWTDFFHTIKHFRRYVAATTVYYICSGASVLVFLLLVENVAIRFPDIPSRYMVALGSLLGPIAFIPLRFAGILSLDRGLSFIQATETSSLMTRGVKIRLFLIYAGLSILVFGPLSILIQTLAQVDGIGTHILLQVLIVLVGGMLLFALLLLPEMYVYRSLLYRLKLLEQKRGENTA